MSSTDALTTVLKENARFIGRRLGMNMDVRATSVGHVEIEGCDTIPKLFEHQVRARGARTAFREKRLGIWRATSWHDYGEVARWTGLGLVSLGLQRSEVVSILADTKQTWL